MLTQKQSDQYRKVLTETLNELKSGSGTKSTVETVQELEESHADWTDAASTETSVDMALKIRDREKTMIVEVTEALQRLESKIYGECLSCGEDIGDSRLKARPTTTLCFDCMTEIEVSTVRLR